MKRKNWMKKADNLVFVLIGCASAGWFFSLLFFASYRNICQEQEQQIQIPEYYDSPVELPESYFDSIYDEHILISRRQEDKELLTDKLLNNE